MHPIDSVPRQHNGTDCGEHYSAVPCYVCPPTWSNSKFACIASKFACIASFTAQPAAGAWTVSYAFAHILNNSQPTYRCLHVPFCCLVFYWCTIELQVCSSRSNSLSAPFRFELHMSSISYFSDIDIVFFRFSRQEDIPIVRRCFCIHSSILSLYFFGRYFWQWNCSLQNVAISFHFTTAFSFSAKAHAWAGGWSRSSTRSGKKLDRLTWVETVARWLIHVVWAMKYWEKAMISFLQRVSMCSWQ